MSALDKKKTYTDMAMISLLETDLSLRAAKKQTIFSSNGNMKVFNDTYFRWKHNYRVRYSEKYLAASGYQPTSTSNIVKINDNELIGIIQESIPEAKEIISSSVGNAQPSDVLRLHMQNTYNTNWSNFKNQYYDGNLTWTLTDVKYKENDDPFEEDDTTIIVGVFKANTGDVFGELSGSGDMSVEVGQEANFVGEGSLKVSAKIEMTIEAANTYGLDRVVNATYRKDSPMDNREWFIYIEYASNISQSAYTSKQLIMSPIIPMKENGVKIKSDLSRKKLLNRQNVDADDFNEMLDKKSEADGQTEDEAVDSAYLNNALSVLNPYEVKVKTYTSEEAEDLNTGLLQIMRKKGLNNNDTYTVTKEIADKWYNDHLREQAYLARGLFKTFAMYADIYDERFYNKRPSLNYIGHCVSNIEPEPEIPHSPPNQATNVNVTFSKNEYSVNTSCNIEVTTHTGKVRPEETDNKIRATFHYSGSLISKKNEEGDRSLSNTPDSKGYDLLEIHVQIDENQYQIMKIKNYSQTVVISGRSFRNTLGYPKDEHRVQVPYYAMNKLNFKEFVSMHEHSFNVIAYSITTVVTKWYKRFAGVLLGIFLCVASWGAGCGVASLLVKVVIAVATTLAVEWVIENIDSDLFKFLAVVVIGLLGMAASGVDLMSLSFEGYLKIAVDISKKGLDFYKMHQAKIEAEEKEEEERVEKLEERIDKYHEAEGLDSMVIKKAYMGAHSSFADANDSSAYIAEMVGGSLFNFDQYFNVDLELETRKQVTSG